MIQQGECPTPLQFILNNHDQPVVGTEEELNNIKEKLKALGFIQYPGPGTWIKQVPETTHCSPGYGRMANDPKYLKSIQVSFWNEEPGIDYMISHIAMNHVGAFVKNNYEFNQFQFQKIDFLVGGDVPDLIGQPHASARAF